MLNSADFVGYTQNSGLEEPYDGRLSLPVPFFGIRFSRSSGTSCERFRGEIPLYLLDLFSTLSFKCPPSPSLIIRIKVERRISLALFSMREI